MKIRDIKTRDMKEQQLEGQRVDLISKIDKHMKLIDQSSARYRITAKNEKKAVLVKCLAYLNGDTTALDNLNEYKNYKNSIFKSSTVKLVEEVRDLGKMIKETTFYKELATIHEKFKAVTIGSIISKK